MFSKSKWRARCILGAGLLLGPAVLTAQLPSPPPYAPKQSDRPEPVVGDE